MKRVMTFLAAFCGLTTFVANPAFAATTVTTEAELTSAVAAGGEIVLGANIALTKYINIPAGKSVTIDLNGETVTAVGDATCGFTLSNEEGGSVTIKDSLGGGEMIGALYNKTGSMTIDGGTFAALEAFPSYAKYPQYALQNDSGTVTINGGSFKGISSAFSNLAGSTAVIKGGVFETVPHPELNTANYAILNRGEMTIHYATVTSGFGAVGSASGSTTIIHDGSFLPTGTKGKTCHVVYVSSGANVTINGGTFKMNYSEDAKPESGEAVASYFKGTLSITGGTFTSHFDNVPPVQLSSGATITGGTYLNHSGEAVNHSYITNYVPDGYELGEDGKVAVNSSVVAKIGTDTYETLADAIAAVGAGEVTITLLNDATLDYGAREAYGTDDTTKVTIAGNGKVLTLNQTNSDWSSFGLKNADALLVLTNMTINKTGYGATNGAWNTHTIRFTCKLEMTNVTVNNSMMADADATLTNVTINEANGYYGLWIPANGQKVTVTGGAITATNGGRGIKIADEYIDAPAKIELAVEGTVFNTAKKAAVLVSSVAGAEVTATDVDITNVTEDASSLVWIDDSEKYAATYGETSATGTVVVNDETKDVAIGVEGGTDAFSVMTSNATGIQGYFTTLQAAIDAAQSDEVVTLIKDVTENVAVDGSVILDLNGKTVTSDVTTITVDGGNLTVTDSTDAANGKIETTYASYDYETIAVKSGGIFTLEKGIVESAYYGISIYSSGGSAVIKGGTVTFDGTNMDGMLFGVYNNLGSLEVTGGTLIANGLTYQMNAWDGGTIALKGGTYDFEPAGDYVPYGFSVTENGNGTWTIEDNRKIFIGEAAYLTLADAFAAAQSNDTITITEAGSYTWPTTAIPAGVTVKGTVDGVVATSDGSTIINATTLTVENVDFAAINHAAYISNSATTAMTFIDCSFTPLKENNSYALLVDTVAEGAVFTFTRCVFNGFTTFTSKVGTLDVNDGEINAGFIVRQDATLDGVTFAETAKVQLGTKDTVTDVTLSITDCNVNGDDSASALTGIINTNGADSSNFVVVDDVTIYGGVAKIGETRYATLQAAIDAAEAANTVNIVIDLVADATLDVTAWDHLAIGGTATETITINGNGKKLTFNQLNSDWNNVATVNDAKLILKDMAISNSSHNDGPWNRHDINFACDVELNNVTSDKALAFKADATLDTVTINDANTIDTYAIWIQPNGQTVSITNTEIDMLACSDGRGIKIDNQYLNGADQKVTLSVTKTTFKTEEKSAILVKTIAGADIALSEVDISGVVADSTHAVWVDPASAAHYDTIVVTGGLKSQDGGVAQIGSTKYPTLQAAYDAAAATTEITLVKDVEVPGIKIAKSITLNLNGKTLTLTPPAVGSTGTETLGMQILKTTESITIKNGTITVSAENTPTTEKPIKMLIQNYSLALTLTNVTLDGTNLVEPDNSPIYVLSNNQGTVALTGATSITAPEGAIAFDVCKYRKYTAPTVTLNTTGTITGDVEVSGGDFILAEGSNKPTGDVVLSAGSVTGIVPTAAEGKVLVETEGVYTVVDAAVEVNGVAYATLQAAYDVAAAGAEITLVANVEVPGIKIAKSITLNLNGKTLTLTPPAVGSTGTETLGMQILKTTESITIKDGTINVSESNKTATEKPIKMLIQNYSLKLTLSNVTLDGTNLVKPDNSPIYVLSNNQGDVTIGAGTTITAPEGAIAFDVCKYRKYTAPTVTVAEGAVIGGKVEVSGGTLDNNSSAALDVIISSGTVEGSVTVDTTKSNYLVKVGNVYCNKAVDLDGNDATDAVEVFTGIATGVLDGTTTATVDWDFGVSAIKPNADDIKSNADGITKMDITAKVQKGDATTAGYAEGVTVLLVNAEDENDVLGYKTLTAADADGEVIITVELSALKDENGKAKTFKARASTEVPTNEESSEEE